MPDTVSPAPLDYAQPPRRRWRLILITAIIAACWGAVLWWQWTPLTGWAVARWDVWTQSRIEQRAINASLAEGTLVYESESTPEGVRVTKSVHPQAIADWRALDSRETIWFGEQITEGTIWAGIIRNDVGESLHAEVAIQQRTGYGGVGDSHESIEVRVWNPGSWNTTATRRLHYFNQWNMEHQGAWIARPENSGTLSAWSGRLLPDEKTVRFDVSYNGVQGWLDMTLGAKNEVAFEGMGIFDERKVWHPGVKDFAFFEAEPPAASFEVSGVIERIWFNEAGELVVAQRNLIRPTEKPPGFEYEFYWPSRLIDRLATFDLESPDDHGDLALTPVKDVTLAVGAFGEYLVSPTGQLIFFEATSIYHGDTEPVIVDAAKGEIVLRQRKDDPYQFVGDAGRSRFSADGTRLYMPTESADPYYVKTGDNGTESGHFQNGCYVWDLRTGVVSLERIETRGDRPTTVLYNSGPSQPRPWVAGVIPAMPRWSEDRWCTPVAYTYDSTRTRFITTDIQISNWGFAGDDKNPNKPEWDNPHLLIVDDLTGRTRFQKPLHDATRIERDAAELIWSADDRRIYITLKDGAYVTGLEPGDPVVRLTLPDGQPDNDKGWATNPFGDEHFPRLATSPDGRFAVIARRGGQELYIWRVDPARGISVRGSDLSALRDN